MKRILLLPVFFALFSGSLFSQNYIYHEATTNTIFCNGYTYRSTNAPDQNTAVTIGWKVEYQFQSDETWLYYTTDGSTPNGAGGTGTGTTQVLIGAYVWVCSSVDIVLATIPAAAGNSTVKYKISCKKVGSPELFSNSGNCSGCGAINSSTNATQYSYSVALPMELTRFEAEKGENFNNLNWQTTTETNNRAFQIERSPDAQNWENIDQVAGAGNSHEAKNYSWTDRQPLDGTSFYRLRQIDFDGNSSLSHMRKIDRASAIVFTVFPNPTVSSTTIKTSSATECEALVDLIDATGRWAGTVHFLLQKGENLLEMPLGGMPGGWYTLVYSAANGNFSQRIFIKSE